MSPSTGLGKVMFTMAAPPPTERGHAKHLPMVEQRPQFVVPRRPQFIRSINCAFARVGSSQLGNQCAFQQLCTAVRPARVLLHYSFCLGIGHLQEGSSQTGWTTGSAGCNCGCATPGEEGRRSGAVPAQTCVKQCTGVSCPLGDERTLRLLFALLRRCSVGQVKRQARASRRKRIRNASRCASAGILNQSRAERDPKDTAELDRVRLRPAQSEKSDRREQRPAYKGRGAHSRPAFGRPDPALADKRAGPSRTESGLSAVGSTRFALCKCAFRLISA